MRGGCTRGRGEEANACFCFSRYCKGRLCVCVLKIHLPRDRALTRKLDEVFFVLLPPSLPSSPLPFLHSSIPPSSLPLFPFMRKDVTKGPKSQRGEHEGEMISEGEGRTMSSLFTAAAAAYSCRDQWPRYWGQTKESTIAAPEATGHCLTQDTLCYCCLVANGTPQCVTQSLESRLVSKDDGKKRFTSPRNV